jgi:hypothetical protein
VLSINLIHLLRLTQSPQLVQALGSWKIFEVKIPINSGLIFSFTTSVLVSGREQLLL